MWVVIYFCPGTALLKTYLVCNSFPIFILISYLFPCGLAFCNFWNTSIYATNTVNCPENSVGHKLYIYLSQHGRTVGARRYSRHTSECLSHCMHTMAWAWASYLQTSMLHFLVHLKFAFTCLVGWLQCTCMIVYTQAPVLSQVSDCSLLVLSCDFQCILNS